jgi:protease-4
MDEESRALLQALVDDTLVQFKTAVVAGRKLSMEKVTAVADGRILTGSQAKQLGLVDELGGLREAIEKAGKMKWKDTVNANWNRASDRAEISSNM